ncbi:DUF397 domain-containing protein [Streptomyces atratus]|uniref:DUF397 domain-containing protein n=1 Tax=Streptomyces atratus TaxID=1893 RepID=A0A2Z5JRR8_STRAR|nr:hypothetical protein C5746_31490 [Streptomyces atratus]
MGAQDIAEAPELLAVGIERGFLRTTPGRDEQHFVEVALAPRTIHVRDSKHVQGPQLAFGPRQWAAFVSYATDH